MSNAVVYLLQLFTCVSPKVAFILHLYCFLKNVVKKMRCKKDLRTLKDLLCIMQEHKAKHYIIDTNGMQCCLRLYF